MQVTSEEIVRDYNAAAKTADRERRMNREELITALRQIGPETGSLCCLGCGYEHGCSVHGCAVIRAAIAAIEHPAPPPDAGEPAEPGTL